MPLVDNTHYVDSVGYTAVTAWVVGTVTAAGVFVRATAPAVDSERVFICIIAGTTNATTQPTWVTTRGARTTDNTVTWQECTGLAGVNGDITNTPSWAQLKAITSTGVIGQLIKNNAATHLFIMSVAGTIGGSEPSFSTTTGATTVDNGATWTCIGAVGAFTGNQAPHARLRTALAANWAAADNDVYIKSSHAETTSGAITYSAAASTSAAPMRILCHNGAAYPPVAGNLTTGATLTSTAASITISISAYFEGLTFTTPGAGTGFLINSTNFYAQFRNCVFSHANSGSTTIQFGSASGTGGFIELDNCSCNFGNIANNIGFLQATVIWKNSTFFFAGSTIPTTLISFNSTVAHTYLEMRGVDLSAAGSGKTLFGAVANLSGLFRLVECKLNASVTVAATPSIPLYRYELINCDSGATNYRNEIYDYTGTLTTELTIVLTGGAVNGVTPIAWKIVTTANCQFTYPFECFPISIWNATTGSPKTLTIQGIWGGGAVPNNDDIWVEVEYLGSSTSPVTSFISDAKATVLTTGVGQDAGTGTWGGSTTKFALAVTFTPQLAGVVMARVKAGAAAATFYIDPKIVLT